MADGSIMPLPVMHHYNVLAAIRVLKDRINFCTIAVNLVILVNLTTGKYSIDPNAMSKKERIRLSLFGRESA